MKGGGVRPRSNPNEKRTRRFVQKLSEEPENNKYRLELAKFLFHQSNFEEAARHTNAVIGSDESNPNAFCLLGRIHGFGKPANVEKASECFENALSLDDKNAKAHYFYAYLLRSRIENFKDAEIHYKRAMALRPDDLTSYTGDSNRHGRV